jgi:hypothetical protein
VRFTVEIFAADDGAESVLHRAPVSSITLLGARKKAQHLLSEWRRRGAKDARVLNAQGQTVYKLAE